MIDGENKMKFHFKNLGCKVNQVEIEQIASELLKEGFEYSPDPNACDIAVINTCTVTQKADGKSWGAIRFYEKKLNVRYVFVTGCYSELEKNLSSKLQKTTQIIAQKDKQNASKIIKNYLIEQGIFSENSGSNGSEEIFDNGFLKENFSKESPTKWSVYKKSKIEKKALENDQLSFINRKRAFIKIQDGCNFFCSYCQIPFARGAPVSRSYQDILDQVSSLVKKGVGEIVISGINLGVYKDENISLGDLLGAILNRCGKTMVRISSIEPHCLDDAFFKILTHSNLAPHIHLPLQATQDSILKKMKRRYSLKEYFEIVNRFYDANKDFALSTDVIVGYPGENEEMFEEGINFIKKCGFNKLHVFPYSPRSHADSFTEVDTPMLVKKKRSKRLMALSDELELMQQKKMMGKHQRFVLEKLSENTDVQKQKVFFKGTSEYYIKGLFALFPDKFLPKEGDVLTGIMQGNRVGKLPIFEKTT